MFKYLLLLAALFFLAEPVFARRIVVLAPAAGDILRQLDLADQVVGKTRSLAEFPEALKVGSHIKPNVELILGLRPDLLIISSNRFFSEQMQAVVNAETFVYAPNTLSEILQQTKELARFTGRTQQAEELVDALRLKMQSVKKSTHPPKVVYEISAMPLSVAGSSNIVSDIIRTAGGEPLDFGARKIIKLGPEAIIVRRPQLYIYQVGPMNQNPTPPAERGAYRLLKSRFLKVNQLQWSRANTQSFERVLELNQLLVGSE